MFNNVTKILQEDLNDSIIKSNKNIPESVDDFYKKKIDDLSNRMVKNHKEFLDKEKNIFQGVWNDLKYGSGSVDNQYRLITDKYKIYNKGVFGSLDKDMDQIASFIISINKDVKSQRNLIKKFIDEKHIYITKAKFETEPIAFSTCFLPLSDIIITTVLEYDNENINVWFMDQNRILEKMINELKLYSDGEIYTAEDIIKNYDKYIVDLKHYFKKYTEYTEKLKRDLEKYVENKQIKYKEDIKITNGKARQLILDKLRIMMDKYFIILKMIVFHYNIQIKFIFESFKSCSRNIQKVYDFLVINYI